MSESEVRFEKVKRFYCRTTSGMVQLVNRIIDDGNVAQVTRPIGGSEFDFIVSEWRDVNGVVDQ